MAMQWLTIPEVAERLRYSTRTIKRYVSQGLFDPVLRAGPHSLRISVESVERFEREHTGRDGEA
jgi:DNA-binding transcriptional MerR regulator